MPTISDIFDIPEVLILVLGKFYFNDRFHQFFFVGLKEFKGHCNGLFQCKIAHVPGGLKETTKQLLG